MDPGAAYLETLLRYQEMLVLVLLAMLTTAACLMTFTCLALLWFEGPLARQRPASLLPFRNEERAGTELQPLGSPHGISDGYAPGDPAPHAAAS